ncbi:MAG: hypothetical protein KatS3mg006_1567 [Pyrinomonadaceae bacterium]|jgi:deoxyribodipyrimidine photolyase-related protein|nr:MAG: hypothetical protein KatS3mg006_1567 [Pyrinomonadaceae bacterium]
MSNYCKKCFYNPNEKVGERACPFNSLYWNFLNVHRKKLQQNQRMSVVYKTWDKFDMNLRQKIIEKAEENLKNVENL